MPSLRKRVSSYFRQLSFHNEPREKRHSLNDNSFVIKYLQGHIALRDGPQVLYGKNPTDLPNYELGQYETGGESIVGCYSGPNGGLTTVKRIEKHLSVPDPDIDFIDTALDDQVSVKVSKKMSPQPKNGLPIDNTTMIIKVAGQEYCVTTRKKHKKSRSLGSVSDFATEIHKSKVDVEISCNNNNTDCRNLQNEPDANQNLVNERARNYALAKSKSDGNPFQHRKKGRIIRVAQRHDGQDATNATTLTTANDSNLPKEWSRKSDYVFGLSDSLYDRNQVTKNRNGDPIADCFGIIARGDSAVLALADGVNWGEKASVAAKSAVHGCLHYLNKTIFHDTSPFEQLTIKGEDSVNPSSLNANRITNTREVFVCLLRAFNCAHDLILENKGMLTTLTVAVVLPLKPKSARQSSEDEEYRKFDSERQFRLSKDEKGDARHEHDEQRYVCCVCNVGDTLAYVYSQKYGVRELTKGSHDINCNRDMRDALGALGPVDGINPELSNLTLSITTLQKGDVILVASDGLTDNFDPNVCRFTVNCSLPDQVKLKRQQENTPPPKKDPEHLNKTRLAPVKPPRKTRNADSASSSSTEKSVSAAEGAISEVKEKVDKDTDTKLDFRIAEFMRENSTDGPKVEYRRSVSENRAVVRRKPQPPMGSSQRGQKHPPKTLPSPRPAGNLFRSKTSVDFRGSKQVPRNEDGIPLVTPLQRYEITLLLMQDVLRRGISGREEQCSTARKLCESLVSFTFSITAAKRRTLEDADLYFDNRNGVMVEVSGQEKKVRRKKGLEKVQSLPGKLDHVSVVAYNVGNFAF